MNNDPAYMTCKCSAIVLDVIDTTHICFVNTSRDMTWEEMYNAIILKNASEDECIEKCERWEAR